MLGIRSGIDLFIESALLWLYASESINYMIWIVCLPFVWGFLRMPMLRSAQIACKQAGSGSAAQRRYVEIRLGPVKLSVMVYNSLEKEV